MKKFKSLVFGFFFGAIILGGMSIAVSPVSAQLFDICKQTPQATVCQEQSKTQTKQDNVLYGRNGILIKVTNLLSLVVGIAAVIIIVVSGLRYIFSAGDSASIGSAKKAIIYALLGLVITLVARSIIAFVINRL